MQKRSYQICVNCVMDTTDSVIQFDGEGVCDHCSNYYKNILPNWDTGEEGQHRLMSVIQKIKKTGKNKPFDCILGMSGGIDSSYMLHAVCKEFELRPLVFHVDGGWNSEVAVNNIHAMINKLNLDLYTEVINWEEMKDFQLAYFKSSLANIDVPQDHAFVATLYNYAYKHNIKYILNGGNFSTECVMNPKEWIYYGTDMAQIKDLIKKFGTVPLKTYPFSSVVRHKVYLKYIRQIQVVKPLNFIPYIKADAVSFLEKEYGWKSYPQKHFESRFTKFYEGYWLPNKFGFDTRRVQYSSLILTGQMSRDEAMILLSRPALSDEEIKIEFEYVAKKLGISIDELYGYLEAPNRTFKDYKNQQKLFDFGANLLKFLGVERTVKR